MTRDDRTVAVSINGAIATFAELCEVLGGREIARRFVAELHAASKIERGQR